MKLLPSFKLKSALSGAILLSVSSFSMAADVKISGWLFQTIVDRDSADSVEFQPLGNSLNAIAFDATHDLGNDLTVGMNLRFSSFTSDTSAANNETIDQQSVSLSGEFGTFDLGQNQSASSFLDSYDGTPSYWPDPMGWLSWTSATGFNAAIGAAPGSTIPLTTGGTTRVERLRYVSPTFSGFTLRAQVGDSDSNELALMYNNYGVTVNAFAIDGGDVAEDTSGFLLAYNSSPGIHAVYTSSTQDRTSGGEDEVSGWKLGYSFSKHSISYSSHTFDDANVDDYERDSITYVYTPIPSFQVFFQSTSEERGSLSDDAYAVGAGIFF